MIPLTVNQIADSIAGQSNESPRVRQAAVVAINRAFYPPTLTLNVSGSTVPVSGVRFMDGVVPVVGQSVWIMTDGKDIFAFGSITGGSVTPAGSIIMFGGIVAPFGWYLCDGTSLLRASEVPLFTAIGIAFGSVDGTHFTLPNWVNKFPYGDLTPGSTGGEATHLLTTAEMPSHDHTQDAHNHIQDSHIHPDPGHAHSQAAHQHTVGGHNYVGTTWSHNAGSSAWNFNQATTTTDAQTPAINAALTNLYAETATNQDTTANNQATGGGGAHNNLPPFLGVNFIIKS